MSIDSYRVFARKVEGLYIAKEKGSFKHEGNQEDE
jgi:hypothetical protein